MRLKDVKVDFSGDLAQCWQEDKDKYDQISKYYRLNDEQKLRYLHKRFYKDAHRFFLHNVTSAPTT